MSDPVKLICAPRCGWDSPAWMASRGQVVYGPKRWLCTSTTLNEKRPFASVTIGDS